ncbi:MAG: response regulator [Aphanocapsa sp. GSE-SYN-MK-11-07L]|jgi:response regulator RpfG family c-di-GMP phosphodiesterase|nr:response regulator [Aphanocapsa sp. GSE-SYN-MK-11-07L]
MLDMNGLLPNLEILKDVQILVVDHHRDSRDLDAYLLESYGANVVTIGSIKGALDILDRLTPDILICEIAFPGERVNTLIERVKHLALIAERVIPILVTSTCPATSFAQHLTAKVEAYLLKPIDLDDLVDQVQNLLRLCCKKDAVLV